VMESTYWLLSTGDTWRLIVGHGCLVVARDEKEAIEILNKAEGYDE
jgi:hypothetical protein